MVGNISGLSVHLRLEDIQSRAVGSCVTNWPNRGYLGSEAYVPWNACPYLSSSTELNGFRPAQFDSTRSLKFNVNYDGRSEYSVFYLARMISTPRIILQSDSAWYFGWWAGYGDSMFFGSWVLNGVSTWNQGWALMGVQYSRIGNITFTRNGRVLGSYYNDGRWIGPNNLVFNWGSQSNERSDFYLAELAVFDRRLTDVERQAVEWSIMSKAGLQGLLPPNHPAPAFLPSITASPTASASLTGSVSATSSLSATLSLGATPTPTTTTSTDFSVRCPAGWVSPTGSSSCYRAAPASLLPAAVAAGGIAFSDAAAACAALPLGEQPVRAARPAAFRTAAEAQFVVRRRCGINASSLPPWDVTDDAFGIWLGLVAAAGAELRGRAVGWAFSDSMAPYAAAPEPAASFLYSSDGAALWAAGEPSAATAQPGSDADAACVRVTASGELDDVPCWPTLSGVCCEMTLATASPTATPSNSASATVSSSSSASMTGSASATASMSPTVSATASMTPTSSATASITPTLTASSTGSPSATSLRTPSETPTASPHCKPEFFSWLPHFELDGTVLEVAVAAMDAAGCRVACCAAPGCTGYSLQLLPFVTPGTCLLYANVTQLVPSGAWGSGLLVAALPVEVAS